MVKQQQIQPITTTISQLERFTLRFEYDKTFQEVKRAVRSRTYQV